MIFYIFEKINFKVYGYIWLSGNGVKIIYEYYIITTGTDMYFNRTLHYIHMHVYIICTT